MSELTEFRRRILGDGMWVVIGYIACMIAALGGIRLITQFVSRDEYGIFSLGMAGVAMVVQVFYNPLFSASMRFYPEMRSPTELANLRGTIVGLFSRVVPLVVVAFVVVGWLCSGSLGVPAMAFVLAAGLLIMEAIRNFEYTLLGAARRQKAVAACVAIEFFAKQGLAVLFVYLLWRSFGGMFCGYLAGELIIACVLFGVIRREGAGVRSASHDRQLRSKIIKYAIPLVPMAVVGWVISLSDRYIINGMIGAEAVGLYAASYGLATRIFTIPVGIVGQVLRPVYFRAIADGQAARASKTFAWWLGMLTAGSIFGVAAIFWLSNLIAGWFLAESFRQGSVLMPWVAAGAAFLAMCDPFSNRLLAAKRTGVLLACNTVCALVCVIVTIWFVKIYGLIGAAMACPVYYGAQFASLVSASLLVKLPPGQSPPSDALEQKLSDERENAESA